MKQVIKQKLLELQDEEYKEFNSNLCPNTKNIIGIRIPILRNYAKELLKKYNFEELMENIDNEYYEGIMLQGILIGLAKEDFSTILEYIKCFVPKINNWSVCDTFCAGLKITKKHKQEMWDFIKIYLKSNKEFEIRFAIVMILDYYIEKEYLSKIFRIFNETKSEYYYVKMAVAWAISICLIKYYDETLEYLKNTNIDVFTYNKALQKGIESYRIDDIKKQTLRKMKK